MRGNYQTTPDTVQNASAEKTRVWVLCALKATRKQLADEKLEWPELFKEALLEEYQERTIYEKSPSLIVVELEHPHFLYKVDWISHKLPQEVSTFEFEKTKSGTLSYRVEPPRLRSRRWGSEQIPIPTPPKEIEHAKFCKFAAWLRALDWVCQQLEWRLQPPEVGSVLKKKDEPSGPEPTQGRPQGQPGKTTEHKDAKHATEPPEEESEKHQPKDFEGLHESQKARNYSDMLASADLTDKQHTCASLAWEYGKSSKEVASRVRIHRRTVRDHLDAARKKIGMTRFKENAAKQMAKTKPGSLESDSLD